MSRKKGGRELSAHERQLWDEVVKRATPLSRKPSATIATRQKTPIKAPDPKPRSAAIDPEHFRRGVTSKKPSEVFHFDAPLPALAKPLNMDQKHFGRMKRGKIRPEARLDLHGLTLADANPALRRFIQRAHAEGLRLVLVITGKGKEKDDSGPIPARTGALRHEVPLWLKSPALANSVLEVIPAHRRHGGIGAYYVYLRRKR